MRQPGLGKMEWVAAEKEKAKTSVKAAAKKETKK
jgi:hypothetical protein